MVSIYAKLLDEVKIIDIDEKDIFGWKAPKLDNVVKFNHEVIACEEDEWMYIEVKPEDKLFSTINEYSKLFLSPGSLNELLKEDLKNIKVLFKDCLSGEIIFQRILPSRIIKSERRILSFLDDQSNKFVIKEVGVGVEAFDTVDAYFDGNNRLYFRNYQRIASIFKGIEEFYRMATKKEVTDFKEIDFIKYTKDFDIGLRNLKMIAEIWDDNEIKLCDEIFIKHVITIAKNYPAKYFNIKDGKFIVENNQKFTFILKMILGRFYKNPITDHSMMANTAVKI